MLHRFDNEPVKQKDVHGINPPVGEGRIRLRNEGEDAQSHNDGEGVGDHTVEACIPRVQAELQVRHRPVEPVGWQDRRYDVQQDKSGGEQDDR